MLHKRQKIIVFLLSGAMIFFQHDPQIFPEKSNQGFNEVENGYEGVKLFISFS